MRLNLHQAWELLTGERRLMNFWKAEVNPRPGWVISWMGCVVALIGDIDGCMDPEKKRKVVRDSRL